MDIQLWLASLDVHTAFEQLRHALIIDVLYKRGVPSHIIALIVRGLNNHTISMDIPTAGTTEECEFANTGVQGGVLTPRLFTTTMETITEATVQQWTEKDWGINLGGMLVNHFWWADNLYLLATSRKMFKQMIVEIAEALGTH